MSQLTDFHQAIEKLMGTPRPCTHEEIDEVIGLFVNGCIVAREAGFAGVQLHAAVSQASPQDIKRANVCWNFDSMAS